MILKNGWIIHAHTFAIYKKVSVPKFNVFEAIRRKFFKICVIFVWKFNVFKVIRRKIFKISAILCQKILFLVTVNRDDLALGASTVFFENEGAIEI